MASKRVKFEGNGGTATAEPTLANYRITFRQNAVIPNGCIIMAGCVDADEARQKLHDFVDQVITQIEKSKR